MPIQVTAFVPDAPAQRRLFADGCGILIGRGDNADIVLSDRRVSREHVRLVPTAEGWLIKDLASKNGTRLDGLPIDSADFDQDAWLSLGGVPVHIKSVAAGGDDEAAVRDEKRQRRVKTLSNKLESEEGLPGFLCDCLSAAMELSDCDRGSIWFAGEKGEPVLAHRQGRAEPAESSGVLGKTLSSGEAVISHDVEGVEALAKRASIMSGGVRAVVCMPLHVAGEVHGAVYADSREVGKIFTELDIRLLHGLTEHAGLTLASLRQRGRILDFFENSLRTDPA